LNTLLKKLPVIKRSNTVTVLRLLVIAVALLMTYTNATAAQEVTFEETSVIEFEGFSLETLCFDRCNERSDEGSFEKMVRLLEGLETKLLPEEQRVLTEEGATDK